MLYETQFLISLSLTLIIEIPIVFIFVKVIYKLKELSNLKVLIVGLIASTLTLPYLWFVLSPYINARYYILTGELIVVIVEALIYNQLLNIKLNKALAISFIANFFSYGLGLIIL